MRCGTLYHVYFTSKGRRLHSLFSSSRLSIGTPQSVISQVTFYLSLGEIGFRCGWTTVMDDDGRQRFRLLLQPNVQMFWYFGCEVGKSRAKLIFMNFILDHHLPMLVIWWRMLTAQLFIFLLQSISVFCMAVRKCSSTHTPDVFLTLLSLRAVLLRWNQNVCMTNDRHLSSQLHCGQWHFLSMPAFGFYVAS